MREGEEGGEEEILPLLPPHFHLEQNNTEQSLAHAQKEEIPTNPKYHDK